MNFFLSGLVLLVSSLGLLGPDVFSPSRLLTTGTSTVVEVGWYNEAGMQDGTTPETIGGYNYEYLAMIAQYTGWTYHYTFGNWSDLEAKLANHEIDLLGDVGKTTERLSRYNYSDYPNISSQMYLVTRSDDARYYYDDFTAFNGMKIGGIVSDFREGLLAKKATNNSFQYSYQGFSSDDTALAALNHGDVDAVTLINTAKSQDYKVISEWEPTPFYFTVSNTEGAILDELNRSLNAIQSADPSLQSRLYEKYFEDSNKGHDVALTKSEANYLAKKDSVTIAVTSGEKPIAYEKDGVLQGILPDYFSLLQEKMPIKFNYKVYGTFQEMFSLFMAGKTELCAQIPDDFSYGVTLNARLANPYMSLTYGFVSKPDSGGSAKKISYRVGKKYLKGRLEKLGYEAISYENDEACISAVISGAVDAAAVGTLAYEQISYHAQYRSLSYFTKPELDYNVCIGVAANEDPLLFSVLQKVVGAIPSSALSALIAADSIVTPQYTFNDYMANNGMTLLALIASLLIVVLLAAFLFRGHRLNKKLTLAYVKADKASAAKSEFLSTISHDLRTPLNGIMGMTYLAQQENNPPATKDYLQKIDTSSTFLLGLINDVLDMSKAESGKIELHLEPYPYSEFESYIQAVIRPLVESKKQTFSFGSEVLNQKETHLIPLVDKLRINQIYFNLLSNAVKYTPEGGHIRFTIQERMLPSQTIEVTSRIQDDGIGMSPEFQAKMFEPFAQESQSNSSPGTGTGLGLSIVKKLVELMGGTIQCESHLHQGTTFTLVFNFPTADERKEKNQSQKPLDESTLAILKGKRVLICEDNALNQEITKRLLEKQGIHVLLAKDGQEGVTFFSQSEPNTIDLILMDIRMPKMNGYQATLAIRSLAREDAKKVSIIALTADAFTRDVAKADSYGMNGHLSKPIDPNLLYRALVTFFSKPAEGNEPKETPKG
jgi:signal transduction histidine kinase/ActR/RegA family two-component response regulator